MQSMSWEEFFKTRARLVTLRRWGSVPGMAAFVVAEGTLLSLPVFDPTQTIAGVDPLVMIGLTTFGGMLTSYLVGGALAGMLWRRFRPGTARLMDTKQKDFYERIVKHRVNVAPDPTKVNFAFDYYGEKINSVADYRQWLRKQRQLLRDRTFK